MKIGAQRRLVSKVKRVLILVMMVAGIVTLFFGCERSAKTETSKLPTPETDPLAQPKSLQQVGAPVEMGHPNLDAAVAQIAAVEEYQQAFRVVFGRSPNGPDLLRAIASYERTQLSFDSPFDHFIAGEKNAIDDSAKRGWELFNNQARCNK